MKASGFLSRYLASEAGATAIEYGLIAAMIAITIVAIAATGGAAEALYNTLATVAAAAN